MIVFKAQLSGGLRPSVRVVTGLKHARDDTVRTVHLDLRQLLVAFLAEPEFPDCADSLLQPEKALQELLRGLLLFDEHMGLTLLAFLGTVECKGPCPSMGECV